MDLVALLLRFSAGWLALAVIAVGLIATLFARRHRASAVMAAGIFAGGAWFWIVTTNIGDVRYFMPFVAIAFILVIPAILDLAERAPPVLSIGLAALAAIPTGLITVMLFLSTPPMDLQRALGINLFTNMYAAENQQASHLLEELKSTGTREPRSTFSTSAT